MMYHHQQHQVHHIHSSSGLHIPSDRHMFIQGGNRPGDSGLVLSTDAKPRLKWTPDLHARFIEAVNQLGGADKATPRTVMKLMGIPGLTLYHLKSHLQKFRLSKHAHGQNQNLANKIGVAEGEGISEVNETHMNNFSLGPQTPKELPISETLKMQIEVQRSLHEQLEVQRHLQLRIEAQGKYLQSVLEKAQETLGRQNSGTLGLEAAKVKLSELMSKVSSQCLNSTTMDMKELQAFCPQKIQGNLPTDSSVDSCLTCREGTQKDHDFRSGVISLRAPYNTNAFIEQKEIMEDPIQQNVKRYYCTDDPIGNKFLSRLGKDAVINFQVERNSSNLTMSIGVEGETKNFSHQYPKRLNMGRDIDGNFQDRSNKRTELFNIEDEKIAREYKFPYFPARLDLNACDENDATANLKQLDLNDFSLS